MRKNLVVSLGACCAILLSGSVALAAENWLGTWKLNTAKSKYSPGPAPKSLTLKWESTTEGIKHSFEGVNSEGKPIHGGYTTRYDGKEAPWTGNPDADMSSATKIDDNTYEAVSRKDGKETIKARVVVSEDGKTLTVTQKGTNAKGQTVNNTVVYERQQ